MDDIFTLFYDYSFWLLIFNFSIILKMYNLFTEHIQWLSKGKEKNSEHKA